ncbi:class II aldolase/adducin family protein [Bradyrhizobium sp. USDA 4486]
MQDFSQGIFKHFTVAAPGKSDNLLVIPFGLHWSELTASSLVEVSDDGDALSGHGDFERSALAIHQSQRARPLPYSHALCQRAPPPQRKASSQSASQRHRGRRATRPDPGRQVAAFRSQITACWLPMRRSPRPVIGSII